MEGANQNFKYLKITKNISPPSFFELETSNFQEIKILDKKTKN